MFCARIADHPQPWFRFVAAGPDWKPFIRAETGKPWVVEDTLTSLVAADPGGRETEQHLPKGASEGVFDAWAHAHDQIYSTWTRLTDVANLQPDIPLALREAAELVVNHGAYIGIEKQQGLLQRLNARWEKRIVDRVRDCSVGSPQRLRESTSSASSSPMPDSNHQNPPSCCRSSNAMTCGSSAGWQSLQVPFHFNGGASMSEQIRPSSAGSCDSPPLGPAAAPVEMVLWLPHTRGVRQLEDRDIKTILTRPV